MLRGVCAGELCAFPDGTCVSGLRYGGLARSVSGLCVPSDGVGGTSTGSTGQNVTSASETSTATGSANGPGEDPTTADLESTGNTGPIGNFLFVDEDNADFAAGTMDAVAYEAGRLRLAAAGQPGTFTSRTFDAGVDAQWLELRWQPDAPYAKPLLDEQALEQEYETGAVDMAANVLLHHFEQPSPLSPGTAVIDFSGRGNDGEIALGCLVIDGAGHLWPRDGRRCRRLRLGAGQQRRLRLWSRGLHLVDLVPFLTRMQQQQCVHGH